MYLSSKYFILLIPQIYSVNYSQILAKKQLFIKLQTFYLYQAQKDKSFPRSYKFSNNSKKN